MAKYNVIGELKYIVEHFNMTIETAPTIDDAYLTMSQCYDMVSANIQGKIDEHIRKINK